MRNLISLAILTLVLIGETGCADSSINDTGNIFVIPREQGERTLSKKYKREFADFEFVNTELGPIPTMRFPVIFETYPIDNEEQKFYVYTTNVSGLEIEDEFYWYLIEDEYKKLVSNEIEYTFSDSGYKYVISISKHRNQTYDDSVSSETTLEEALDKGLVSGDIDIYLYKDNLTEEDFINRGNELVKNLRDKKIKASLSITSTFTNEGFEFIQNNPDADYSEYQTELNMYYTFGKIEDSSMKYGFRYKN